MITDLAVMESGIQGHEATEKIHPADLIILHALCGTQDLTIPLLIHINCNQTSYIFILFTPITFKVDSVHIHMQILLVSKRAVSKEIPLSRGICQVTSPVVVVRLRIMWGGTAFPEQRNLTSSAANYSRR